MSEIKKGGMTFTVKDSNGVPVKCFFLSNEEILNCRKKEDLSELLRKKIGDLPPIKITNH